MSLFLGSIQVWGMSFACSPIKGSENQHGDFDIRQICLNQTYVIVYRGTFETSSTLYKIQESPSSTENGFELNLVATNDHHTHHELQPKLILPNEEQLPLTVLMDNPTKVYLVNFERESLEAESFQTYDLPIEN